jgi:hypothetical protein
MRLYQRKYYSALLTSAYTVVFALWYFVPSLNKAEFLFTLAGGVTAVASFTYSWHLESAKFFRELFVGFNKHYDKLNESLNRLRDLPAEAELNEDQKQTVCDYFNLCGEEFFFYQAGYIDETVWRSWASGMEQFLSLPQVRRLAEQESLGSYYGFKLVLVE